MSLYRTYATAQDYADYTGKDVNDLPSNIDTLLKNASNKITNIVIMPIPDEGVDEDCDEVLKFATCEIVKYQIALGEQTTLGINYTKIKIGNFEIDGLGGDSQVGGTATNGLPQEAINFLNKKGLLYRGARTNARSRVDVYGFCDC